MKAFKVITIIVICWLLVGVLCMIFKVPFHPYGDYWNNTALVLLAVDFAVLILFIFKKK